MPRVTEAKLLLSATVLLAAAVVFFHLSGGRAAASATRVFALAGGSYWAVHLLQYRCRPESDPLLLPLAAWMSLLGLIFLYRLDPELAARQAVWVTLGLGGLAFFLVLPGYLVLAEYKYLGAGVALVLLAATLLVGAKAGGAKSWLELGFLRFQPVEAVKLLMIVFLAGYLDEHRALLQTNWRQWGPIGLPVLHALLPLLAIWGLSLFLVAFQRDLGGALLLFGTLVAMLYLATGRALYLVAGFLLLAVGFAAGYYLFDHVRVRIQVWLDPWAQVHGAGYQVVQGFFSLAAGGLWGTGLGLGQAHYVPAVATDYLFVALAEEMGLAGALGLLSLYLLFTWRGFRLALNAAESVGRLLAGGLTALFALQTLLITGGVTGLLPLTGVTLPFFSYGGSATVVYYLLLGLLLQVSGHQSGRLEGGG